MWVVERRHGVTEMGPIRRKGAGLSVIREKWAGIGARKGKRTDMGFARAWREGKELLSYKKGGWVWVF